MQIETVKITLLQRKAYYFLQSEASTLIFLYGFEIAAKPP